MAERITVSALAKELGLGQHEIYKQLVKLGLQARSMAATLPAGQADQVRKHNQGERAARARHRRKVQPIAAALRRESDDMTEEQVPRRRGRESNVCQCCERRWLCRSEADEAAPLCSECRGHYPIDAETVDRQLARQTSHAHLYAADRDKAYRQAEKSHSEREAARQEMRREVDAAYEARSKWRRALALVMLDHEPPDRSDTCWCGDEFPCRTWRRLEQVNRGIYGSVEELLRLSPDERADELKDW